MYLRKAFRLFVILNIVICTSFSPFAGLSEGFSDPIAPTATTRTVCASGCDHTSIQAAIDVSDPGDTIDLASETYTETITIDEDITLIGEGSENTIIQAANLPNIANNRVVTVVLTATATIDSVTIRFGKKNGGAGIHNRGILTITNSVIISNTATNNGGGIFNTGKDSGDHAILTIIDTVVSNNSAGQSGGGIYNYANDGDATLMLIGSDIIENVSNQGGGIYNYGFYGVATTRLLQSKINGNQSAGDGGGIYNKSHTSKAYLYLTSSTLDDNTSDGSGGGIINSASLKPAYVEMIGTTISNNTADYYGGGFVNIAVLADVTMTLTNTTISGNNAGYAGAIYNFGSANAVINIFNSTISTNTASIDFNGVWNFQDTSDLGIKIINISGSIIANNNGEDCRNTAGVFNDISYNIIETGDTSGVSCVTTGDGDPGLGPLQDNGGPTFTHALLPGSQALDAIPSGSCLVTTDQRGWPRPIGSGCDIGAYEFGYLIYLPLIMR